MAISAHRWIRHTIWNANGCNIDGTLPQGKTIKNTGKGESTLPRVPTMPFWHSLASEIRIREAYRWWHNWEEEVRAERLQLIRAWVDCNRRQNDLPLNLDNWMTTVTCTIKWNDSHLFRTWLKLRPISKCVAITIPTAEHGMPVFFSSIRSRSSTF